MADIFQDLRGHVIDSEVRVRHSFIHFEESTRGSTKEFRRHKNQGIGADSLENMAIHSVLYNLPELTVESLATTPWRIGEKVWNKLSKAQLDSLKIWKAFNEAYRNVTKKPFSLRDRTIRLEERSFPPDQIFQRIDSTCHGWLSHLSLVNVSMSDRNLMKLSQVKSLASLFVDGGLLSDRVIRGWKDEVFSASAFSNLVVMLLKHQTDVTERAFVHLRSLPALQLLGTKGLLVDPEDVLKNPSGSWQVIQIDSADPQLRSGRSFSAIDLRMYYEWIQDHQGTKALGSNGDDSKSHLLVDISSSMSYGRQRYDKAAVPFWYQPCAVPASGSVETSQSQSNKLSSARPKKKIRSSKQMAVGDFLSSVLPQ
ncbi:hypothetical protein K402DRAFT_31636 [Aulographum hederae CBS 113979]|uniref:Uncharacterized protein n=1 Tax=Aulographum hederae CBS 113979 TaxID=1176131 RepID=A0A6G1H5F8_9PEZI|nr:hypothetical protein K402DRAFT_31636 [Aulographum hederae CBS 113979]